MMKSRMGRWGRIGLAGVATVGALSLAACGGGPAGAGAGGGGAEELDELKVALITHQAPGDTFFDIMRAGADTAGERNNIEVLYSSDPDGSRQAQLVEQAIDQNVDGIVVALAKADAMSGSVQKAVDAGIPVFSVNAGEDAYADMGVLAHFGQNEYKAGQALGEQLNEQGSQRAVCVIQEQGHVGLEARCEGMADTYEGESEVLYVQGTDMTNVQSTIASKLQTNSDIDYVVTLGAPFAMTALDSVGDAGTETKVGTVDLNTDVYQSMQDDGIQFAIDQQPFMQGYMGVESVRQYVEGGYVLGGGEPVLTGPTVITMDNLDSVAAQFEGGGDEDENGEDEG